VFHLERFLFAMKERSPDNPFEGPAQDEAHSSTSRARPAKPDGDGQRAAPSKKSSEALFGHLTDELADSEDEDDEEQSPLAKSDQRAQTYNRRHPANVAQFNRATGQSCAGPHGVEVSLVRAWQEERGLVPDGRIGSKTLRAAKRSAKGEEPGDEHEGGGGIGGHFHFHAPSAETPAEEPEPEPEHGPAPPLTDPLPEHARALVSSLFRVEGGGGGRAAPKRRGKNTEPQQPEPEKNDVQSGSVGDILAALFELPAVHDVLVDGVLGHLKSVYANASRGGKVATIATGVATAAVVGGGMVAATGTVKLSPNAIGVGGEVTIGKAETKVVVNVDVGKVADLVRKPPKRTSPRAGFADMRDRLFNAARGEDLEYLRDLLFNLPEAYREEILEDHELLKAMQRVLTPFDYEQYPWLMPRAAHPPAAS
jgi:hypothetical protein